MKFPFCHFLLSINKSNVHKRDNNNTYKSLCILETYQIFINKSTYIIPTDAFMTYRSAKDTENVSRHFFYFAHVKHLLEVINPL